MSAAVTITFVSASSPLYPFNPWDDANCFFTLGRGIIHGYVPYRDLYEQKGPLLYFIYAFAALISEKSFIGVWLVECAAASVFAIFSWKTTKLFTEPSRFSIALVPLFLGITYTLKLFNFGGNAEELCFPLLTIAFYFGLKAIVNKNVLPSKTEGLICGIITGILFWIKYTFVGFMAGFCIYFLVISVKQKDFKRLWTLIWRFILGFIIVSLPVLCYFLANSSIEFLWEAYFYNNISYYHTGFKATGLAGVPVIKHIYIPIICFITLFREYPSCGGLLVSSLASFAFIGKEYRKKSVILFAVTFALSAGMVYTRSVTIYYYGYLMAYCFCLILIPAVKGMNAIVKIFKHNEAFIKILLYICLTVTYALSLINCKNMYLIFQPKEFLSQYRMAKIINQTQDAKILTYDVMDAGFYTAAGILPSNRFFCYLNIEKTYPAIREEQDRLIEEGYYDYIITSFFCEKEFENYELIEEDTHPFVDFTGEMIKDGFRLYKRI